MSESFKYEINKIEDLVRQGNYNKAEIELRTLERKETLSDEQEVVIKSLGGYMKDVKGVAGGTILGDGRVGLILDLAGLIETSEKLDRSGVT